MIQSNKNTGITIMYDRTLLWLTLVLIAIGFIMITSASVSTGQRLANDPFLFAKRDCLCLILTFFLSMVTLLLPIKFWQRYSIVMLIISIIMLFTVLLKNNNINGATRWIIIGPLSIQPAEYTKLSLFCYLANYLSRNLDEIRNSVSGLLNPIVVITILTLLLLKQPDLGTIIILFITSLAVLFLSGVKTRHFMTFISISILINIVFVTIEPYRIHRVISFWNPWKDPFGNGYQLTQSLMAFGRGELYGQGLGNSIQKLKYLPEAHTDFIFSIMGEELGYIGVVLSLLMIFFIVFRAMSIGHAALKSNHLFSGFLACSISIWFSLQTLINVGTTLGMLPTKGLTLPLISYGGSSLLVMSTAIMMLLRIDYEMRLEKIQAFARVYNE